MYSLGVFPMSTDDRLVSPGAPISEGRPYALAARALTVLLAIPVRRFFGPVFDWHVMDNGAVEASVPEPLIGMWGGRNNYFLSLSLQSTRSVFSFSFVIKCAMSRRCYRPFLRTVRDKER